MPKNKGKGGKNRRRGKNENEETKRQLEFKEPGQEYSQVVRMLGNGRCECYCFDGVTRLGQILCGNQPVRRVYAAVLARGTGIATPSSRRRVDGVEDDAMLQHERAVTF